MLDKDYIILEQLYKKIYESDVSSNGKYNEIRKLSDNSWVPAGLIPDNNSVYKIVRSTLVPGTNPSSRTYGLVRNEEEIKFDGKKDVLFNLYGERWWIRGDAFTQAFIYLNKAVRCDDLEIDNIRKYGREAAFEYRDPEAASSENKTTFEGTGCEMKLQKEGEVKSIICLQLSLYGGIRVKEWNFPTMDAATFAKYNDLSNFEKIDDRFEKDDNYWK